MSQRDGLDLCVLKRDSASGFQGGFEKRGARAVGFEAAQTRSTPNISALISVIAGPRFDPGTPGACPILKGPIFVRVLVAPNVLESNETESGEKLGENATTAKHGFAT